MIRIPKKNLWWKTDAAAVSASADHDDDDDWQSKQ